MTVYVAPPPPYVEARFQDFTEGCVEFLEALPGYDPSYEVIHFDEWSDYEEFGWFAILRKDGQLFEIEGGYSVMASGPQDDRFDPHPVAEECALQRMIDWEGQNGFLGSY